MWQVTIAFVILLYRSNDKCARPMCCNGETIAAMQYTTRHTARANRWRISERKEKKKLAYFCFYEMYRTHLRTRHKAMWVAAPLWRSSPSSPSSADWVNHQSHFQATMARWAPAEMLKLRSIVWWAVCLSAPISSRSRCETLMRNTICFFFFVLWFDEYFSSLVKKTWMFCKNAAQVLLCVVVRTQVYTWHQFLFCKRTNDVTWYHFYKWGLITKRKISHGVLHLHMVYTKRTVCCVS